MARVGISVVAVAVIAAGLVHGSTPQDPTVLAPTTSTPGATPVPTVQPKPKKRLKRIPAPIQKHRRGNCCDVDPQMCGKGSPSG